MSSHVPAHLIRQVRERANDCCEYCRLPQKWQEATFHIDHVTPKAVGGETALNNLGLRDVFAAERGSRHGPGFSYRQDGQVV